MTEEPHARPRAPARTPSERLHRLADAAVALSSSLSVQEVVERVTEEARTIIGAHQALTSVVLQADGSHPIHAVSPPDGAGDRTADHMAADAAAVRRVVRDENRLVRRSEWLAAPLVSRDGHNLGLVELSDKDDGPFTADDEATLVQLAQMTSIVLDHAVLSEREQATARALQDQLMPEKLPSLEQIDVAARYRAGGAGIHVGGDWYDVIPLDERRVGLVIGDVMGRGVPAASVMGQLRIAVRAYALQDRHPAAVLQAVDELVASLDDDYFVTALYGLWDLAAGVVTFANAGHLAPLLRLPDRSTVYLTGTQGTPIGVHAGVPYREHRVDVPAGSTLVLFTDGLVEHRDLPLGRALGQLARATAMGSTDPEDLVDDILHAMPDTDGDDVAVLAVRHAIRPVERRAEERLPDDVIHLTASPATARTGRKWVARALRERGLGDLVETVELLTSEVVTNAVVHADTEFAISLELGDTWVRVAVSDKEAQLPSMGALDLDATGGRGMVLLHTLAHDWGVYMTPAGKTVWFELIGARRHQR